MYIHCGNVSRRDEFDGTADCIKPSFDELVHDHLGIALLNAACTDVGDAAARRAESFESCLSHHQKTEHVQVDLPMEMLTSDLVKWRKLVDSRIVNQNVDGSQLCCHRFYQGIGGGWIGEVRLHRDGPTAGSHNIAGNFFRTGLVARIIHCHFCATASELANYARSYALNAPVTGTNITKSAPPYQWSYGLPGLENCLAK